MFCISKSRNEYSHSFIYSSVILILMAFLFILFLPEISYSDRIWVSFISAKGGSKDSEEGAPPEISIIQSNDAHTLVHVSIPGMWVDTVMGPDGFVYQVLEVPDYATTNDIGLPELPAIRGLLGIPDNAQVSMVPQIFATQILENYYVWPHQRPICDGEIPVFEKNEMFYNSNSWFPLNHNEVGEPGIFKYYTVDNVGYIPFSYNPYLRQLNVSYDYNIDVIYNNGGTIPEATMDEDMENLMRMVIWNFDELNPNIDNYAPVYYLIITPDEYYDVVNRFSEWLRTIYPYNVTIHVVKLSDIGIYPDCYDIKAYIKTYYYSHNSTDYVLLIGDLDKIDNYKWKTREQFPSNLLHIDSDYWYELITGPMFGTIPDLYPDIAIGRFSFNSQNVNELLFQFSKEVNYYNSPLVPTNDVLLVAHKQNDNVMKFHIEAEKIANYLLYKNPKPVFYKCYGVYGAINQDVKDRINAGMSSVCYLGHGLENMWLSWSNYSSGDWTASDIFSLENYNKPTVVFNYCCLNGRLDYEYGNCLCENWMKGGFYNNNYIAAVATFGHSHENFFNGRENKCNFMEIVYKGIYGSPKNDSGLNKGVGWILNTATVSDLEKYNFNFWFIHNAYAKILFGDPALRIRTCVNNKNINVNDINKTNKLIKLKNVDIKLNNPVYNNINIFINSYKETYINIEIYDISGRKINNLYYGRLNEGENNIEIDNINLKTGLYILNIYSDFFNEYKKVVVIE